MHLNRRRRLLPQLLLGAALVGTAVPSGAATAPAFQVGITHTQYSADTWRDPTAVSRARTVLSSTVSLQAQALMGWGANSPEPAPGVYDWASFDARLKLITSTGGTPIVTLCCSPDWMKGGVPNVTDWSRIEVAPSPLMYDEYAKLAVAAAQRHPEVRNYLVWNELKGFYDPLRNAWDIEAYTRLYNKVYDALKAYDPTLKVGGPYVPMDIWADAATMSHPSTVRGAWGVVDNRALTAMTYWLANMHGTDMVVVDGGTWTKDKGLITDDILATSYFATVTKWLKARTKKPIWWSEFTVGRNPGSSAAHGVQVLDRALGQMQASGVAVAMQWHDEGADTSCVTCIWTSTADSSGGVETPYAAVMRAYNRRR
jgi:hypothetical protein